MIRTLRGDDVPAAARIWRELRPDAMQSERGLRHLLTSFPERAQGAFWVAEKDGAVVAWCLAHRRWHRATDNGYVWLGVLAAARGRGLGRRALGAGRATPASPGSTPTCSVTRAGRGSSSSAGSTPSARSRDAPMLAINRHLGYAPFTERRGYLKELRA
ncbi:MAG: GNAT family N-acetyltransferase [Gaiellaceae bacterium]